MAPTGASRDRQAAAPRGVQALTRAFEILEHLADAGGEMSLSELTRVTDLPMPTVHRLVRTLVGEGYVRQAASRRYALGPQLIRLGDTASRLLGRWARPYLTQLAETIGETTNMALLDGDEVVYVAQAPSKHSMRMFTEVGRRVLPHCTAVGKVLLAQLSPAEADAVLGRTGLPAQTPHTITDPAELLAQLKNVRAQGYAMDDGEQELGVQCIAVPVVGAPERSAISVSGPEGRLTESVRERVVPVLQRTAADLATSLTYGHASG